ncbi:unnamed protein product [Paramecium octaurelia]|uniref:Uncharacterized protein n=1 Tax=Paramecium octaurelia TaxID=43137 RepID=A0A8S1YR87_PAROT|nr:unnamed protein product [Paramecium octaurelia]
MLTQELPIGRIGQVVKPYKYLRMNVRDMRNSRDRYAIESLNREQIVFLQFKTLRLQIVANVFWSECTILQSTLKPLLGKKDEYQRKVQLYKPRLQQGLPQGTEVFGIGWVSVTSIYHEDC